ncbi:hypothetical protein Tsubulata_003605 [Turnera subulata]|uniref:Uncharacterized protein n=1 Tax=Turnera subulata TaxID=218843 RepID=A0A9Q0FPW3_9ROSI|nr:hypothetical protein Tsubulata_003605 [Turnera subulata]
MMPPRLEEGLAATVEGQSTDHDRAQRSIRLSPSPLRGCVVFWDGDGCNCYGQRCSADGRW